MWLDYFILFDTLLVDVKLNAAPGQETHSAMCNAAMLTVSNPLPNWLPHQGKSAKPS
jgi:hypothetical protein